MELSLGLSITSVSSRIGGVAAPVANILTDTEVSANDLTDTEVSANDLTDTE